MAKLNTKKASNNPSVIVYGAPKTGKTQIVGELSEHFNLIWIDMEQGHGTLFKLPEAWQSRIELIDLRDTKEYPIAIETVLKLIKAKPVSICEEHGKVDCMVCKQQEIKNSTPHTDLFIDVDLGSVSEDTIVVFDSITQLTTSAVNNITRKQPDDYKLQTDDWGHLAKIIDIFATTIQQARYKRIVISHEIEAETEGKKRTLVPVAGSRNSSRNIAKAFDHVVYCERKNKKHVFSSGTTDATNILAGSRTDANVGEGDKPSLLTIFQPSASASASVKQTAPVSQIKKPETAKTGTPTVLSNAKSSNILERLRAKQSAQNSPSNG